MTSNVWKILTACQSSKIYRSGSDTLFVWFGGINEPFFSEAFPAISGFDCIYLRDSKADWYVAGLNDITDTSEAFTALLTEAATDGYKYVCFAGQSSGGYSALYYGLKCHADLCIPFSPQTRNLFNGQCAMTPHVKLEDVADLYRKSPGHPDVVVHVSRSERDHLDQFEWRDHDQINELEKLDRVTKMVHPYDNHAISVLLRRHGLLYPSLISLVKMYKALKVAT